MDPSLIASIIGGLGGMLGGPQSPELTPYGEWGAKFNKRTAKKAAQYGRGVPGSAPDEQAAMAQAMALLGLQQGAGNEAMFAGVDPSQFGTGAVPDMAKSLDASNRMESSGLIQQMLMKFLGDRRNLRFNVAPNLAMNAVSAGSQYRPPQPTGWEGLAPSIASMAYAASRRRSTQPDDPYETQGTSYSGWSPTSGSRY